MKQVVIENPVLNSPFIEPARHFKFTDDGITDEINTGRRISSYFVPIPRSKKRGKQLVFDTEWTDDRIKENEFINRVRGRVAIWRQGKYPGVTRTTTQLLEYWTNPERERKLFFCQIEALETAIYLGEVAKKYGDAWIENQLREANDSSNPLLYRMAFKMATGSGKTVVMAMLIAWQALNKLNNRQDARFSDTFLIVTPGITIRDDRECLADCYRHASGGSFGVLRLFAGYVAAYRRVGVARRRVRLGDCAGDSDASVLRDDEHGAVSDYARRGRARAWETPRRKG